VEVRIGHRVTAEAQGELQVAVRDTGPGIPESAHARLFDAFTQVDASTTRKYGGTGLGLAICKRLVHQMGGDIGVESTPGMGSTFRFSTRVLPVLSPAGLAQSAPALQGQLQVPGRRVLIADGNAACRRILANACAASGLRPVAFASADAVLVALDAGEVFDLALLDTHMLGADGRVLADRVRGRATAAALPIVAMSRVGGRAVSLASDVAQAHVHKPLRMRQLLAAITDLLAARHAERAPLPEGQALRDLGAGLEPGSGPGIVPVQPERVLIAEDNVVNQQVVRRMLEKLGYRSDVVANGLEVLAALHSRAYDVVFMDVQMPELDGLEASRRIARRFAQPGADGLGVRPWIIALTANAIEGDRDACLAAGMDDYLSKPVKVADIAAALARARSARDGRATPAPWQR
jgi:CheY-like chemotaxis protein